MTISLVSKVRRTATVLGAAAVLIAAFATPASAGYGTISGTDHGSASGQATMAGLPSQISYSVKACDIKADGHHARAMLYWAGGPWIGDEHGWPAVNGHAVAKATGGNGTCVTVTGNINVGSAACSVSFTLWVATYEGNTELTRTPTDSKDISVC